MELDGLELQQMITDAVRATVAVQQNALNQALADDAVATAEEKAAHADGGSGMDDCSTTGGGAAKGCWELQDGEIVNCYCTAGAVTKDFGSFQAPGDGIVYAKIMTDGTASVSTATSVSDVIEFQQSDKGAFYILLYKVEDGGVVIDFRNMPHLQVFEETL